MDRAEELRARLRAQGDRPITEPIVIDMPGGYLMPWGLATLLESGNHDPAALRAAMAELCPQRSSPVSAYPLYIECRRGRIHWGRRRQWPR